MKCRGHTSYPESTAWYVAKKLQRSGDSVHAWHCRECGGWHVGFDRNRSAARKSKADRIKRGGRLRPQEPPEE